MKLPADKLQLICCPPKCTAGGKPEDGGHKFTVEYESDDGLESGYECEVCGLTNVAWSLWAEG